MKTFALMLLTLTMSQVALADQCQILTAEQAERAVKLLPVGQKLISYCEPCGDNAKTKLVVETIEITGEEDAREVLVNGESIDLAYTFVKAKLPTKYVNLAKKVGCEAEGVSTAIFSL